MDGGDVYFNVLEEDDLEMVLLVNHPIVCVSPLGVGAKHDTAKDGEALRRGRNVVGTANGLNASYVKHSHLL